MNASRMVKFHYVRPNEAKSLTRCYRKLYNGCAIDLTVQELHVKRNVRQNEQRTPSIARLSKHLRMDVHEVATEAEEHSSINITCKHDAQNGRMIVIPTESDVKHDTSPLNRTRTN